MSGKFEAGGTLDKPKERVEAWLQAELELEERRKERERNKAAHDGKTLFEVLQANKAAKEDAFQESIKLKNQFRALNDDEVDFLDSQADAARAKEQAVRQETNEQLDMFRQKQEAASRSTAGPVADDGVDQEVLTDEIETNWSTSKKRKRAKEKEALKGVKARRGSSDVQKKPELLPRKISTPEQEKIRTVSDTPLEKPRDPGETTTSSAKKTGLSLVSYGSDEESD